MITSNVQLNGVHLFTLSHFIYRIHIKAIYSATITIVKNGFQIFKDFTKVNICENLTSRKFPATMEPPCSAHLGTGKDRPEYGGVFISGVENVLWQSIVNHLVPVTCVHIREVSAIEGWGLD